MKHKIKSNDILKPENGDLFHIFTDDPMQAIKDITEELGKKRARTPGTFPKSKFELLNFSGYCNKNYERYINGYEIILYQDKVQGTYTITLSIHWYSASTFHYYF